MGGGAGGRGQRAEGRLRMVPGACMAASVGMVHGSWCHGSWFMVPLWRPSAQCALWLVSTPGAQWSEATLAPLHLASDIRHQTSATMAGLAGPASSVVVPPDADGAGARGSLIPLPPTPTSWSVATWPTPSARR